MGLLLLNVIVDLSRFFLNPLKRVHSSVVHRCVNPTKNFSIHHPSSFTTAFPLIAVVIRRTISIPIAVRDVGRIGVAPVVTIAKGIVARWGVAVAHQNGGFPVIFLEVAQLKGDTRRRVNNNFVRGKISGHLNIRREGTCINQIIARVIITPILALRISTGSDYFLIRTFHGNFCTIKNTI